MPFLIFSYSVNIVSQIALQRQAVQEDTAYYDALVVSAAEKLGCHEIISEDLSDGQLYHGMRAINPFK